jgi:hypothetical protein
MPWPNPIWFNLLVRPTYIGESGYPSLLFKTLGMVKVETLVDSETPQNCRDPGHEEVEKSLVKVRLRAVFAFGRNDGTWSERRNRQRRASSETLVAHWFTFFELVQCFLPPRYRVEGRTC